MINLAIGDITKVTDVDAIVNAANCSLLGGGGVDGAIHRAAGPALLEECHKLHGCKTGQAKITSAYNLPVKYVIHTPGPVWQGGQKCEDDLLANCYKNCMLIAIEYQIRNIAFPSISTGVYGFPVKRAAKIAVNVVSEICKQNPDSFDLIKWVLFDKNTFNAYKDAMNIVK